MSQQNRLWEERIGGERLYAGKILELEVDHVRLPNGVEAVREVIRHQGAAVVLPLQADGRVVMVNQYRYPLGKVLLELPAGKVDSGESPLDCAARELEEETGWRAGELHELGSFFSTPGFSDEKLYAFFANHLEPVEEHFLDSDEFLEVVTLSKEEILIATREGTICDGKTLAVLFLAQVHGWL